jgi:hypothetical protein
MMTDNAMDLRARMEAELIALRRAQSIFAESHPSVDVHGKLQDLQEMYIGDLLVKDCQISQMKEQLESFMQERTSARSSNISTPTTTASLPSPHASMLAARVQSLQRSVSSERQRRQEVEARLEDVSEEAASSELAQIILAGDSTALSQAMERAAQAAQVSEIRLSTQKSRLTRRLLDEMGIAEIEKIICYHDQVTVDEMALAAFVVKTEAERLRPHVVPKRQRGANE